jgi:hypothetical protein
VSGVERFIAKVGWTGALMLALGLSVGLNAWQLYRSGGASSRCEEGQAKAAVAVHEAADERDAESADIVADVKTETQAAVVETQADTIDRQETVRVVYRTLPPLPADCPRALPERVHETLDDAAAAANGQL